MREHEVKLLFEQEVPVGAVVLEFVFNVQIRRQIAVSRMWDGRPGTLPNEANGRFINHSLFSSLVRWLERGDELPTDCVAQMALFTTSAFGYLLSKCTAHSQTAVLMQVCNP